VSGEKVIAELTIVGPDRKGVVAGVTGFVFQNRGNIEKISQSVTRGLFGMQLEASFPVSGFDERGFQDGIRAMGRRLGMRIRVHFDEPDRLKNMAVLVSKEPHCLEALLEARRAGRIRARIPVVIGTHPSLKALARRHRIPFVTVPTLDQPAAEEKILAVLERYNIDFIVLARYMRILTPNFVWRYPNRILNIHPSLLPAFAGASAYVQAYERGAQIVGVTAHFVTEELDQGPILVQDSFRVRPGEGLEEIRRKGRQLESRTLCRAVRLYLENRPEVHWGKVRFAKKPARSLLPA
jgi:formyltetrahydrofolate deformylase